MTRDGRRVAIITGGSQSIGAGLVAGYRGLGWAVVANARTIKPSQDPDVLTVEGDIAKPSTGEWIIEGALERQLRWPAAHRGLPPGRGTVLTGCSRALFRVLT
jgi:NAD(P)-dependent dehydrogenase (short-subunit alcohol dehydrogenase family)